MLIRCWGSRGSIPVSGREYIKYGGDTTCMEIRSKKGDLIIIDGGTGLRPLGNALCKEEIKTFHMLFTHAHWDHLMGFPLFRPIYMKGLTIKILGYPFNKESIRDIIKGMMSEPYFPVDLEDKDIGAKLIFKNISTKPFKIGSIKIKPIFLNHPKNGGLGYRLEEDGKSFVFLTDNELGYMHNGGGSFKSYVNFCKGADLLIHDGEYDEVDYMFNRGWGHSLFTDAVDLGIKAGVKQLGLFHLNNMRNDDKIDAMVKEANRIISKRKSKMKCLAVGCQFKIKL